MNRTSLAPPLGTVVARVLLVAFIAVQIVLVLGDAATPPDGSGIALLMMSGAAAIVVLVPGGRLGALHTATVVALIIGCVAVIIPWLPANGWPGYASWPLGAGTFVIVALTLRGRIGSAWITMAAMAALCFLWAALGGASPIAALGLFDRHIGILLLGTLFAIGLGRSARAHDELVLKERAEVLERDLAEAELAARREAVARVLADAGPTLERIAAGVTFDPEEQRHIAAIEGRLRDEITLAPILSATLDHALEAARLRGLDVIVLTEPSVEDLSDPVRLRAAEWIAAQLDRAKGAEFVGRVVRHGGAVRVSATVDEHIEDRIISDTDD